MEDLAQTEIPGLESLSEESHQAGKIKRNDPILVILGNPPYSGHSATKNDWTEKLLKEDVDGAQSYYKVDGEPLGERNPKWLQDDYVKFLRFSQWKIHKAGHGIVGMITNHSYLDNPTFRGMRQSLMNTFNEIYIIDLHGNGLKKETTPEGGKDENVFDIRQGVSIFMGIKKKGKKGCNVFVDDLSGLRKEKYDWLAETKFSKKTYEATKPNKPFYFLKKDNTKDIREFLEWPLLENIFPVFNTGIVTKRDGLAIASQKHELLAKINTFKNKTLSDEEVARVFNLPLKDNDKWDIVKSRAEVNKEVNLIDFIKPISYRPFDTQQIFYHDYIVARKVESVMSNMLHDNLGLVSGKNWASVGSKVHDLAFISDTILDLNFFRRGGAVLFPLYLYKKENKQKNIHSMMLFEPEQKYGSNRRANISSLIIDQLEASYKTKFESKDLMPEHILHYCYGILFSNVYRKMYAEFLKIDFPRIPFTRNQKLFLQIAELGNELTELHLLKRKSNSETLAKYRGKGDDKIVRIKYDQESGFLFINEKNYFEGISTEVWDYTIGGYQVLDKYLKSREDNLLKDPAHFCKVTASLARTIEIQKKLDDLFKKIEFIRIKS